MTRKPELAGDKHGYWNECFHDSVMIGTNVEHFYKSRILLISFFVDFSFSNDSIVISIDTLPSEDTLKLKFNKVYNTCYIQLYGSQIDRIKLNYGKFRLWFGDNLGINQKNNIYERLINKQKKDGYIEGLEILSIEHEKFKHYKDNLFYKKVIFKIINWWWKFGFRKERIFYCTFKILLFFILINTFWFKKLIVEIYPIKNINRKYIEYNENKKSIFIYFIKRTWLVIYYTSLIFFNVRIKNENFISLNPFGIFYISAIHIIGIICLAFMFNYFITS